MSAPFLRSVWRQLRWKTVWSRRRTTAARATTDWETIPTSAMSGAVMVRLAYSRHWSFPAIPTLWSWDSVSVQRLCRRLVKLLRMAQRIGFGGSMRLAEGISSAAGTLPTLDETTAGELANLSFGQGKLTATPVQVAVLLAAVANGGCMVQPFLQAGDSFDGKTVQPATVGSPIRVMSEQSAKTLRELLVSTVENGTGYRAENRYCGSGGKTASAQTGRYRNGEEIVHAWFGGFFPAEQLAETNQKIRRRKRG